MPKEDAKKETKYISLSQAAKFCNYSQDYLNLRARQKIKGGKNGSQLGNHPRMA